MIKNFITVISNPTLFTPTIYLAPEILEYNGHTIIHVHVPPSAEVHSYKNIIYDRVDDADVKVTATSQIAAMYIRKQDIYTEKKVFPYAELDDLRLDLLPQIRQLAVNHAGGKHPWETMNDIELLKSAGLYSKDRVTGQSGFNLAAILLLGKDDVIKDVCPTYVTDALVRRVNMDRYDDREIIQTNLIESYGKLMDFAIKHLPDKFYLDGTDRISLRNIIAREMLVNTIIHREFSSSYTAKFIIEQDKMYVENANRATKDGIITPDNLEPNPKNPVIASFFRTIGWSDQLGSGVRNLYKYTKLYSGKSPTFQEGDIFRIIVPLDESYSFDKVAIDDIDPKLDPKLDPKPDPKLDPKPSLKHGLKSEGISENEKSILNLIKTNPSITRKQLVEITGISDSSVKRLLALLQEKHHIRREGSKRTGKWIIL